MGRNQARRRGEVDHGRAGAIPEGQVRQSRVAGIESPPLRVPADVLPLPHLIHTVLSDERMEIRRKLGSDVRNVGGVGHHLGKDGFNSSRLRLTWITGMAEPRSDDQDGVIPV